MAKAQSSFYFKGDLSVNWNKILFNKVDSYFAQPEYSVMSGGNPHLSVGYTLSRRSTIETGLMYRINDLTIMEAQLNLYGISSDLLLWPTYYSFKIKPNTESTTKTVSFKLNAGVIILFQNEKIENQTIFIPYTESLVKAVITPYTNKKIALIPMVGIAAEMKLRPCLKGYIEYQYWHGFVDFTRFGVTVKDRNDQVMQKGYLGQNGTSSNLFFGVKYEL